MPHLSALVANGTFIVQAGAPKALTPAQLDKLSIGIFSGGLFPFLTGIAALIVHSGWRRKGYSYSTLSALWLWSVTIVGVGIFAEYGKFNHLVDFLAILHVQVEWLIIGLLLKQPAEVSAGLSALVGVLLYTFMFALPGIRGTFLVTSLTGGFGDAFMPLLLLYGKQHLLALGGVGHFISAFVTFQHFVQYIDISTYLSLQLIAGALHGVFTVAGLVKLSRSRGSIHLPASENGDSDKEVATIDNPMGDVVITKKALIILIAVALAGTLGVGLPMSFWPRHY